jgi:4'-phosphopantetheinyl transferase
MASQEGSTPETLLHLLRQATERATLYGGSSEAHLHLFAFDSLRSAAPQLGQLLSSDELERAGAFRFPEDQDRFCLARGVLRLVLGCYLHEAAERLAFEYAAHGKPALARGTFAFNASHTREHLALAFAGGGAIGVDVESEKSATRMWGIARRFFAPAEQAKLAELSPDARRRALLRCWTQKEAYTKAIGLGLALRLDQFEVAVLPDEPCGVLASHFAGERERWRFFETDALPNAHVSLVTDTIGRRVRMWNWVSLGCHEASHGLLQPQEVQLSLGQQQDGHLGGLN